MPTAQDAEKLAQKILADPNTSKIAQTLGVPLEEYAETVLRFMLNPGQQPEFVALRDEDLKKLGHPPPDPDAMRRYIEEALRLKNARAQSGFDEPRQTKVDLLK